MGETYHVSCLRIAAVCDVLISFRFPFQPPGLVLHVGGSEPAARSGDPFYFPAPDVTESGDEFTTETF